MNDRIPVTLETHRFVWDDFIGGAPAVDFVNTVTGRNASPRDWLPSYEALCSWALTRGIIDPQEFERLARLSRAKPEGASALKRAKALREAMFSIMIAWLRLEPSKPRDSALLAREWRSAVRATSLIWGQDFGVGVAAAWAGLDTISCRMAIDFVQSSKQLRSDRFRQCAGVNCGWTFIDMSKSGRRKWCDMATCGNSQKVRRFRSK